MLSANDIGLRPATCITEIADGCRFEWGTCGDFVVYSRSNHLEVMTAIGSRPELVRVIDGSLQVDIGRARDGRSRWACAWV